MISIFSSLFNFVRKECSSLQGTHQDAHIFINENIERGKRMCIKGGNEKIEKKSDVFLTLTLYIINVFAPMIIKDAM